MDVGKLIYGSSECSQSSLNIQNFTVHILLKLGLENFEVHVKGMNSLSPESLHLPIHSMLIFLTWYMIFDVQSAYSLCCKLLYTHFPSASLEQFSQSCWGAVSQAQNSIHSHQITVYFQVVTIFFSQQNFPGKNTEWISFPTPGYFPTHRLNSHLLHLLQWQMDYVTIPPTGKPLKLSLRLFICTSRNPLLLKLMCLQ